MSRRASNRPRHQQSDQANYDYEPLISPGITMLKFGRGGTPHERLFTLSSDLRYLRWNSGWFSRKLGSKSVVDLEKVIRIMPGQNTFQFQKWSYAYGDASEKSFSILYIDESSNRERTLDLIAPSPDIFRLCFGGLKELVKRLLSQRQNYSADSLLLKSLWDRADTDHSGTLEFREILRLISSINIYMKEDKIKEAYKKFDKDRNGKLDFQEFIEFMSFIRKRPDLEAIWTFIISQSRFIDSKTLLDVDHDNFHCKDAVISLDQFIAFWDEVQDEALTPEEARNLIDSCNVNAMVSSPQSLQTTTTTSAKPVNPNSKSRESDANYLISYAMFSNVMRDLKVTIFDPAKSVEYQDMSYPISYYFMATSHNTYLEGDQLTSHSSVNRYVNDLLSGCRCVELDCWDGDNGYPVICHGHTITGKILFKDVIKAIYDYAFENSPYPVVLSIENHCSLEQQKILTKIMIDGLKDQLALPMKGLEFGGNLPSPTQLMHKVLIKGKRTDEKEDDEDEDEEEELLNVKQLEKRVVKNHLKDKKKEKAEKTHPDLAAITFLGTCKVKDFRPEVSDAVPADMMSSFSENTTLKHLKVKENIHDWRRHNTKHLSRIYPKGTRIDSSNYMPTPAWATGSQMVALNYQTGDIPYHINFGKFLENGKCGYVLKPEYMTEPNSLDKPLEPIRLIIHIISAAFLPKPGGAQKGEVIDPFVRIFVDSPEDNLQERTKAVSDNGFNPVFNQIFTFDIKNPDLSYLTFHVCDDDVLAFEFICFSSLPITCIRPGLRTVPLYGALGGKDQDFEFSQLFVRISIEPLLIK